MTEHDEQGEELTRDELTLKCAARLGYEPKDLSLLRTALTHRSYSAENKGEDDNERLEFLGDAVLDLVLSDILFRANHEMPEGEMAKARSAVVNEDTLADVASELELGSYMFFGKGEARSGGAHKRSLMADAVEAVIAAIYLDRGYETAKDFIVHHWEQRAENSAHNPGEQDYKTRFQEILVKYNGTKPRYQSQAHGPEHDRSFSARVFSNEQELGAGTGRSKKLAEQDAAKHAIEQLSQIHTSLRSSG